MKHALVIHPVLSSYAGGEYLCLNVCEALQEMEYHVSLACDVFRPSDIERIYGLGRVMEKCSHVRIPEFRAPIQRFMVLQRLLYAIRVWPMLRDTDADIVFSTQSSPFIIPQRIFHFVYNADDLFSYPPAATPPNHHHTDKGPRKLYFDAMKKATRFLWRKRPESQDWLFAIGSNVLGDLRKRGYRNSSLAFPPCRVNFKPRFPKKKQVVQAARIIPEKRLELYFDIASRLPEYRFYLVGRDAPLSRKLYPGYSTRLLSRLPRNVTYVDAFVRERPELLEESKVYVYTGAERGIGLALVEAIAAGCIPFLPLMWVPPTYWNTWELAMFTTQRRPLPPR